MSVYTTNSLTGQLAGKWFERHALQVLQSGKNFKCWNINSRDRSSWTEETVAIFPRETKFVEKVCADQRDDVLYVPLSQTFPGIDAWVHGVGGFQITLNAKHALNASILKNLPLIKGEGAHRLYWVLRNEEFDIFRPPG